MAEHCIGFFLDCCTISVNTWLNFERGTRGPACTGLDEPPNWRETSFLCHYSIEGLCAAPILMLGLVDCQSAWVIIP